jgi:hypothetical protein
VGEYVSTQLCAWPSGNVGTIRSAAPAVLSFSPANAAKVLNMSFGFGTPERMAVMRELMARHPEVRFG